LPHHRALWVLSGEVLQAIDEKGTVDLPALRRRNQDTPFGVEKVFEIPNDRGLGLPEGEKAVLDRLMGNPGFEVNEPVQDGGLEVLLGRIHYNQNR
jgi:hypothetical protein